MRFFTDTISNGGFKPLTKEFNQRQGVKNYNTYDYVEMIIRGRWPVHPGNEHIDGEGKQWLRKKVLFIWETNSMVVGKRHI